MTDITITATDKEMTEAMRRAVHDMRLCEGGDTWAKIAHPIDPDEDAEGAILMGYIFAALAEMREEHQHQKDIAK